MVHHLNRKTIKFILVLFVFRLMITFSLCNIFIRNKILIIEILKEAWVFLWRHIFYETRICINLILNGLSFFDLVALHVHKWRNLSWSSAYIFFPTWLLEIVWFNHCFHWTLVNFYPILAERMFWDLSFFEERAKRFIIHTTRVVVLPMSNNDSNRHKHWAMPALLSLLLKLIMC